MVAASFALTLVPGVLFDTDSGDMPSAQRLVIDGPFLGELLVLTFEPKQKLPGQP
jgi:hypothetical protein